MTINRLRLQQKREANQKQSKSLLTSTEESVDEFHSNKKRSQDFLKGMNSQRRSSASRSVDLQQLDHQAALQRGQLAAVVLPQDGAQTAAEALQARQRAAVRHVEQRVEELQPQVGVGVPDEEEEEMKSGGAEQ